MVEACYFSWDDEMDRDASVPASDPALFPHVHFAQRRLCETIFRAGRLIFVRLENGQIERAKVEVVCGKRILVNLDSRMEWVDLEAVVPDSECKVSRENEEMRSESRWSDMELSGMNVSDTSSGELTAQDLKNAFLTPVELIKVGQYMELQDARDPRIVHIAEITSNRGGLLTVKCEEGRHEKVFITNERCHAIGWTMSGEQQCGFAPAAERLLEKAQENSASPLAFSQTSIKEHKFEVGMMLEVLDTSHGGVFYPGFVCDILNAHYFRVRVSQSLAGPAREIVCHRSHPHIFPVYWCQRHFLRLTPPEDYGIEDFSWNTYRMKCGLTKGSAPEHCFDLPRTTRRFEKLRNVEVLDIRTKDVMYPGKIVRSMRHLVWVHLCHYANATPPAVYSTRSRLLFPCGFAERHGIRLQEPARYLSIEPSPSDDRFNLRMLCTSRQTPVFITPKKRFLSGVWLRGDLWLPIVTVRKTCFPGPFIHPEKFKQIPDRYPPGPMPAIMRVILSDLICSAYKPKELCELLSCAKDSQLPQIIVKARIKFKRFRARVECCEKLTEFCGWLRSICILLDACPDLFGISTSPCESYCSTLADIPSMNTYSHVWTVNLHTVTQKSIPRRFRRITPGPHGPSPVIKKKKKRPVIQVFEPRRPLTRAIAHTDLRPKMNAFDVKQEAESTMSAALSIESDTSFTAHACCKMEPADDTDELSGFPPVQTNPKMWTPSCLSQWVRQTDVASVAATLEEEEIDGEAFMLLSLNDCIDYLDLKLGPALKLNALVKGLIMIYNQRYCEEAS